MHFFLGASFLFLAFGLAKATFAKHASEVDQAASAGMAGAGEQ